MSALSNGIDIEKYSQDVYTGDSYGSFIPTPMQKAISVYQETSGVTALTQTRCRPQGQVAQIAVPNQARAAIDLATTSRLFLCPLYLV